MKLHVMLGLAEALKSDLNALRSRQIYALVFRLCVPAIMMQMATFAMQYIDAAMVGSLGASASASVSVVFSSIWIAIGLSFAMTMGFFVQIAHAIGANDITQAKRVFREGLLICCGLASLLSVFGIYLSPHLPAFWGQILKFGAMHLLIFSFTLAFPHNAVATLFSFCTAMCRRYKDAGHPQFPTVFVGCHF
ncbi:MAG: MATE family efflux transporter [bacterium]